MKLLLLKILLQRRGKDEGFTLPMVIALGLVMLLLGAISIVKSGEENVNTILQSQRIDALAVAELGAAQYRQFFDRNRSLIIQNRNEWSGINEVCEAITDTTNGWASSEPPNTTFNAANWRQIELDEDELNQDVNGDGDRDDTIEIGSYKIVDYEFDLDGTTGDTDSVATGIQYDIDDSDDFSLASDANPDDDVSTLATGVVAGSIDDENDTDDDGESNARGILTIKGRTPDGSEAQIEYEIPVRINEDDLENLAPALWIDQSNITTAELGTLQIENGGQLVVTHRFADGNITWPDETDATQPCQDPPDIRIGTETIDVVSDPRGVPSLASIQDYFATVPANPTNDFADGDIMGLPSANEFDDGDPDNDPEFYYTPPAVGNITIGSDVETDGVADVVLYVDGNITFDSSVRNIGNNDPNNTSSNLQISSTGNITINTGGGIVNINALIHAPNGTLTISGNGTVNITGSVWVDDFNANGSTVTIMPDDTDTSSGGRRTTEKSYTYYGVGGDRLARPITQPPTTWKTEEVN